MTKKIVHLTTVHPSNDVRIFHKECVSLAKAGYQVTLIAPHDKDEFNKGVKIKAIQKSKNRLHRLTIVMWQAYHTVIKENADVYHFHDPELLLIALLLRLKGKVLIYDVHEDVPRDILLKPWLPKWLRKPISVIFEKIENFVSKYFQGIVTVTPKIQQRFKKINFNTIEVRNYSDMEEFKFISANEKRRRACYFGSISVERGIYEMVRAANKVNIPLCLGGNFNSNKLYEQMIKLPEWYNVNYLGQVDRQKVVDEMMQSAFGFSIMHPGPTFNDSLPIKLFEYMSVGIPVIASDFPLWREIIEDHQCGLIVNPNNMDEIINAINYLISNPDHAREMGERGQFAVARNYNWSNEAGKLAEFYKQFNLR